MAFGRIVLWREVMNRWGFKPRGLCLRSTSIRGCPRFSFIARHIKAPWQGAYRIPQRIRRWWMASHPTGSGGRLAKCEHSVWTLFL